MKVAKRGGSAGAASGTRASDSRATSSGGVSNGDGGSRIVADRLSSLGFANSVKIFQQSPPSTSLFSGTLSATAIASESPSSAEISPSTDSNLKLNHNPSPSLILSPAAYEAPPTSRIGHALYKLLEPKSMRDQPQLTDPVQLQTEGWRDPDAVWDEKQRIWRVMYDTQSQDQLGSDGTVCDDASEGNRERGESQSNIHDDNFNPALYAMKAFGIATLITTGAFGIAVWGLLRSVGLEWSEVCAVFRGWPSGLVPFALFFFFSQSCLSSLFKETLDSGFLDADWYNHSLSLPLSALRCRKYLYKLTTAHNTTDFDFFPFPLIHSLISFVPPPFRTITTTLLASLQLPIPIPTLISLLHCSPSPRFALSGFFLLRS